MKIIARKRVYWFYFILAILFFFFYLFILQNLPYQVNYSYSDIIMRKLLNADRSIKLISLYFFFVCSTSFIGYVISSIVKEPSYQKSFLISFIISFLVGFLMFIFII